MWVSPIFYNEFLVSVRMFDDPSSSSGFCHSFMNSVSILIIDGFLLSNWIVEPTIIHWKVWPLIDFQFISPTVMKSKTKSLCDHLRLKLWFLSLLLSKEVKLLQFVGFGGFRVSYWHKRNLPNAAKTLSRKFTPDYNPLTCETLLSPLI